MCWNRRVGRDVTVTDMGRVRRCTGVRDDDGPRLFHAGARLCPVGLRQAAEDTHRRAGRGRLLETRVQAVRLRGLSRPLPSGHCRAADGGRKNQHGGTVRGTVRGTVHGTVRGTVVEPSREGARQAAGVPQEPVTERRAVPGGQLVETGRGNGAERVQLPGVQAHRALAQSGARGDEPHRGRHARQSGQLVAQGDTVAGHHGHEDGPAGLRGRQRAPGGQVLLRVPVAQGQEERGQVHVRADAETHRRRHAAFREGQLREGAGHGEADRGRAERVPHVQPVQRGRGQGPDGQDVQADVRQRQPENRVARGRRRAVHRRHAVGNVERVVALRDGRLRGRGFRADQPLTRGPVAITHRSIAGTA